MATKPLVVRQKLDQEEFASNPIAVRHISSYLEAF